MKNDVHRICSDSLIILNLLKSVLALLQSFVRFIRFMIAVLLEFTRQPAILSNFLFSIAFITDMAYFASHNISGHFPTIRKQKNCNKNTVDHNFLKIIVVAEPKFTIDCRRKI